jgi:hypothetical protein
MTGILNRITTRIRNAKKHLIPVHCTAHQLRLCLLECANCVLSFTKGRAIAQAVSRWLPTAAARVRSQVRSCRICGGQSGTEASFLRVLRFPLPILIPPTAPQ